MCGNHLRKQGVCQQDVSFYLANKTYTKYWSFPSHIVKHLPPTKNTIKRNWASDFLKNPMNISNSKVILNQENKDRGPAGLNLKLSIFLTARTFSCMNHLPEDAKVTCSPKSVFAFFFFLKSCLNLVRRDGWTRAMAKHSVKPDVAWPDLTSLGSSVWVLRLNAWRSCI